MKLEIDPNWSFKELVDNLKVLRTQYEDTLRLFSWQQLHEQNEFVRQTRNSIYALKFPEWQRDKIWNYMNHYEFLYVLEGIAKRQR